MSTDAARLVAAGSAVGPPSPFEQLRYARDILSHAGQALLALAERLPGTEFLRAAHAVATCGGSVIVTGMGKAGLVGLKIAATLASTGTPSHFLHPAEAVHGDLGRVRTGDCVLALSFRGETEELLRILPPLQKQAITIISITGRPHGTLARGSTVVLNLGPLEEADHLGLAPSTSTTAMLAMGDALALVASRVRGFRAEDFAKFHPGGSLGRKLALVDEVMRRLAECRVAEDARTVREVLVRLSRPGRRTGAIMLVDEHGGLSGIFTDSDLARLFERHNEGAIDRPIRDVMTARPSTIALGSLLSVAVDLMAQRKISELPVVDPHGRPAGLIDVTDLVGLVPPETTLEQPAVAPGTIPFPPPGKNTA